MIYILLISCKYTLKHWVPDSTVACAMSGMEKDMESSVKAMAEPQIREEPPPGEIGKANMDAKPTKQSKSGRGRSPGPKKYIKVYDDRSDWKFIQKTRSKFGLPPQPFPIPSTEVKQEKEEEPENNQEGLATAVGSSSSCASIPSQISTTVLSSDFSPDQALTPGRIEGHLERLGHRPPSKTPMKVGALKRGPMQ